MTTKTKRARWEARRLDATLGDLGLAVEGSDTGRWAWDVMNTEHWQSGTAPSRASAMRAAEAAARKLAKGTP